MIGLTPANLAKMPRERQAVWLAHAVRQDADGWYFTAEAWQAAKAAMPVHVSNRCPLATRACCGAPTVCSFNGREVDQGDCVTCEKRPDRAMIGV